jgi:hypothetical protein
LSDNSVQGGAGGAGHSQAALLGCAELLAALQAGGAWLDHHIDLVNALNVFPVPDGDTGTNMCFTMRAALAEVGDAKCDSVSELARMISHGALMGARGNSGVILSQILRGFARGLDSKHDANALDVALALKEGAVTAYKGVMKPVEGTILTVVREAAEAAEQAAHMGADVRQTIEMSLHTAERALARTPQLLPVLAEAGVVDSGGQGLVYILEGMLRYLNGEEIDLAPTATVGALVQHTEALDDTYNYDAQFIIHNASSSVEEVRERIAAMGDSVLVVGDEKAIKVHVHCDHPGEALEYALSVGQLDAIIIENMQIQYEQFKAQTAQSGVNLSPAARLAKPKLLGDTSVVAVVSGKGLEKVFESLGAEAIVPGGQTMNPSTQDLLRAIDAVAGQKVVLLPNNSNIILTAQQARDLSSKQVVVVPSRTMPQGIAAMLSFNYQFDLETNLAQMSEATHQVITAEITRAVRTTQVNGLAITEGEYIGLLDDNLVTANADMDALVRDLLERGEVADCEIVTIYYGEDSSAEEAAQLGELVQGLYPDIEVEVLEGGQPHYHYVISAE